MLPGAASKKIEPIEILTYYLDAHRKSNPLIPKLLQKVKTKSNDD